MVDPSICWWSLDWDEKLIGFNFICKYHWSCKILLCFSFAQLYKLFLRDCLVIASHRCAGENAHAWKITFSSFAVVLRPKETEFWAYSLAVLRCAESVTVRFQVQIRHIATDPEISRINEISAEMWHANLFLLPQKPSRFTFLQRRLLGWFCKWVPFFFVVWRTFSIPTNSTLLLPPAAQRGPAPTVPTDPSSVPRAGCASPASRTWNSTCSSTQVRNCPAHLFLTHSLVIMQLFHSPAKCLRVDFRRIG